VENKRTRPWKDMGGKGDVTPKENTAGRLQTIVERQPRGKRPLPCGGSTAKKGETGKTGRQPLNEQRRMGPLETRNRRSTRRSSLRQANKKRQNADGRSEKFILGERKKGGNGELKIRKWGGGLTSVEREKSLGFQVQERGTGVFTGRKGADEKRGATFCRGKVNRTWETAKMTGEKRPSL